MPGRRISLVLATAALAPAVVACGSGGGGSSGAPHRTSSGKPVRVFHVQLSGRGVVKPKGAPAGTGAAVVALHHRAVVCFRFAHLHGFTDPTTAALHLGPNGQRGAVVLTLSHTHLLHHQGCVRAHRSLGAALERSGAGYYVEIDSRQYPQGAVRGSL
jgi:hypothetical protein